MSAEELIAFWDECPSDAAPYVHPKDRELLLGSRYSAKMLAEAPAGSDRWVSSEFESQVHLGLLPVPYIGDLRKADIIICLLNPGFAAADYYAESQRSSFRKALEQNLRQQFSNLCFPFFSLDPQFCWTSGYSWWLGKLRSVVERLAETKFAGDPIPAIELISRRIAAVEMFPYHSRRFSLGGVLRHLPSANEIKKFVDARRSAGALIIVTRQAKAWNQQPRNNCIVYEPKHARSGSLTPESNGGKAILERLGAL